MSTADKKPEMKMKITILGSIWLSIKTIGVIASIYLQINKNRFVLICTSRGCKFYGPSTIIGVHSVKSVECFFSEKRQSRLQSSWNQYFNAFLGMTVEVFLDQENYMLQKFSKNAGAKIVIHDPYLPPLPDEYGIDMQPNTASSVALQTVRS